MSIPFERVDNDGSRVDLDAVKQQEKLKFHWFIKRKNIEGSNFVFVNEISKNGNFRGEAGRNLTTLLRNLVESFFLLLGLRLFLSNHQSL